MTATGSWRPNSPSPGRNLGWVPKMLHFYANQCGSFLTRAGILVNWDQLTFWGSWNIVGSIPENTFPKKARFIWGIPVKQSVNF